MKKPTIYLDTNVISMRHYSGSDLDALASRMATRDWWESERRYFHVVASALTERELSVDVYRVQEDCVRFVRRLPFISQTPISRKLAQTFLDANVIPSNKPVDAAHLALATSHGIDYL